MLDYFQGEEFRALLTDPVAFFKTKEFWAAVITSLATIFAVWLAVFLGLRKLTQTELKKQRIKYVIDLIAYRFVLAVKKPSNEAQVPFFAALGAIPGLFGHDKV